MDEDTVFVDYKDFDGSRLKLGNVEQRRISYNGEKYMIAPIYYDYGTSEDHLTSNLYLQLPPCKLKGIRNFNDNIENNKFISTLFFNISDESTKCIETIKIIYEMCCDFVYKHRVQFGLYDFDAENPRSTFKSPIIYERDRLTGEIIQYKNPMMNIKVIPDGYEESQFLYQDINDIDPISGFPNLKPIKWSYLRNSDIKVIPLVKFESINVNCRATIRCVLTSAIILDYKDKNIRNYRQIPTANIIYNYHPNIANKITTIIPKIYKYHNDNISDSGTSMAISTNNAVSEKCQSNIYKCNSSLSDFLGKIPSNIDKYTSLDDFLGNCKK